MAESSEPTPPAAPMEARAELLSRTTFLNAGITTEALARRTRIPADELANSRPDTCHIDASGRWWPVKEIGTLDEWCLIQPDPGCVDPGDIPWSQIVNIDNENGTTRLFTESFAWSTQPSSRRVIFQPHPLAVTGPW